jgi:hypothetical protein
MKQYCFVRWVVIGGFFMIFLALAGPVGAAPSVDLALTPTHIPPFASGQLLDYTLGEPVVVNVTLTNQGPGPITIMGFPPKRGISQRNQTDFLSFPRSSDTATIGPDRTLAFDVIWDQKNAQGMQVDSGLYTIAVYYLLSENTTGKWDLSHVEPYARTVDIVVLPKGGALTADIPVNQSQVVDNVSVTLESVYLSNTTGVVIFTFHVPEDIPYRTHPAGWKWCYLDFLSVEAQYSIDHNTPRQFFYDSVDCDPPHSFRSTFELDPIAADAHEMEINLTVSGSHQGSSFFRVNLTPYSTASAHGTVTPITQSTPLPVIIPGLALCCISLISITQNKRRKG